MPGLTKLQMEEVQALLNKQAEANLKLSPGQRWDAVVLLGGFTFLAVALLGFGGRTIVSTAAKEGAERITADTVAESLSKDTEFISAIAQSAPTLPNGSIIAFSIGQGENAEQPQCPIGWSFFEESAGRFIIGAGAGNGLTPRPVGGSGGSEQHILTVDELPPQQVEINGLAAQSTVDRYEAGGKDYPVITRSTGTIGIGGGSNPISLIPPYLALYYCKKG
jgi:hypothetical protein